MSFSVGRTASAAHGLARLLGTPSFAIPLLWALVLTFLFAIPFSIVPWPFGDVYTVLGKADTLGWRDTVVDAFSRDLEYRPFFTILVKVLYSVFGLRLWLYKVLVLLQFAATLWVLIWICRPEKTRRMVAVILAVSCVVGLHTSRILFSFFPVNHHSLTMLLVLVTAGLALDPRGRRLEWLFVPITVAGLFLLEFGLLIPPVLAVLFFAKAEGVTRRAVIGSWIALGLYIVVRFTLGTQTEFPIAHAETGLGFEIVERKDLNRIFAHAPLLFWTYNVCATLLTVLVSEPRSGTYYFINSLIRDNTQQWLWLHVISSAVTTAGTGWILSRRGGFSLRDRQLVWLGMSLLILGSALGFLYARDRIGLPVGLGYGILVYVAAASLLEHPPAHPVVGAVAALALVAILGAWLVRDVENWLQVRDTAWERHIEWTERFAELGGFKDPETPLLRRLRSAALSMPVEDPRHGALWTYSIFERRVKPDL